MSSDNVRVRFAPSPTGGLHIGGVRTALFNYLYAKHHGGTFVLRIEDTDQTRYVEGAEDYIREALHWCGIDPDEGPQIGGDFGPYRQSERKNLYGQYVQQLLDAGHAYYAFDTPEELDQMRERLKAARVASPQYNTITRMTMRNSLTLSEDEVQKRLNEGQPYVVRIKVPRKEEVRLNDLVRGWVMVHSTSLDDKVLMKSDGMPTYHLANVVDDYLMKITHVIRGEEWLPSAPLHVLLYKFLGWEKHMPHFAHLPLILKPDGNGKLSKRAAENAGFPIFPLSWTDPESGEVSVGFRETGFLPDAMINFLSLLGWNPGTNDEVFSKSELVEQFTTDRIGKAGTKFDFEKAKWFNQQYIKKVPPEALAPQLKKALAAEYGIETSENFLIRIIDLLKDRVTFFDDFVGQSLFFFQHPAQYDEEMVTKKWSEEADTALSLFANLLDKKEEVEPAEAKQLFHGALSDAGINPGKYMPALRLAITGGGSGPDLMAIVHVMGPRHTSKRLRYSLEQLKEFRHEGKEGY